MRRHTLLHRQSTFDTHAHNMRAYKNHTVLPIAIFVRGRPWPSSSPIKMIIVIIFLFNCVVLLSFVSSVWFGLSSSSLLLLFFSSIVWHVSILVFYWYLHAGYLSSCRVWEHQYACYGLFACVRNTPTYVINALTGHFQRYMDLKTE